MLIVAHRGTRPDRAVATGRRREPATQAHPRPQLFSGILAVAAVQKAITRVGDVRRYNARMATTTGTDPVALGIATTHFAPRPSRSRV
jgi:hypothetical protein